MIEGKKSALILTLKILKEYSDENHYLTQQDIISKMIELYGVELERKTISSTINLLIELDYDIYKSPKGGYCLLSRVFDNSQISFLIDAIFSSKAIPGKESKEMINKLSSFLSVYNRKNYDYLYKSIEINRTSNREVFYNIDIINEAIQKGKKISFQYEGYDEKGKKIMRMNGYRFRVSPYYLVNNFGKYYCLSYYRYNDLSTFRIDLMYNIKILEDRDIVPIIETPGNENGLDIVKYINENVYLFGGEVIAVELVVKEANSLIYIYEWFGNNVEVYIEADKLKLKVVCNKRAFYYWIMQYNNQFEVVSPQEVIDMIVNTVNELIKTYEIKVN